ncbi:MAG: precorrin-2 C(20)-methyltransferase [Firmicutes bacterium]|nr:precorrin-2 C(20)-methyltransferase [Bacillota bacterium]
MEKQGVFYAVSVGPGDPELLTRQACRVLADCPVVAAPRMKSGRMLALDIAAGAVDMQGKTILPLDFTMERSEAVREDSYRMAAAAIEAELSAGRDVAMVNLGDVSVYATAYYILERIRADGFETVMCPGVTSFCAVAARLGRSLTRMEEPLHILPGSTDLDNALHRADLHRSAAAAGGNQLFCHHRGGLRGRYGAKSPPAGAGRHQ